MRVENNEREKVVGMTVAVTDTMITKLEDLIAHFRGKSVQTCCFLHVVNLIAKSFLKEFDLPKKKANEVLSNAEENL